MKIVFVYTGEEYLGIEYLSAFLKENGYQTQLVYDPRLFNDYYFSNRLLSHLFSFQKRVINEIIHSDADLVAFSINSPEYRWASCITSDIKKKIDIPIVFGGHHPTCVPEEVLNNDFIDFVIQGEGEYALLELVRHLEGKKNKEEIKNLYYKSSNHIYNNDLRSLIEDLDDLPFPDKELFYSKMKYISENYTIMTSRGCPYSCSYCHNSYLKQIYKDRGRYLRRRSVENVIKELKEQKKRYKIKNVMFQDEIFTLDFEWLKEFSAGYKKEIDLPYACYVHPNTVDSKTADLLHLSGCVSVNIGIESIDEKVRKELLFRSIPQSQIVNALTLLMRNHIYCRAYFVIGLPGQKEKDLIDLARFCNEYRFGSPIIFWLQCFPKTEIAEIAKKERIEHINKNFKEHDAWLGYSLGGDTFDISLSRLKFLAHLAPLIHKSAIEYIIQERIYRFFPAYHHIFYLRIVKILLWLKNIFSKKKKRIKVPMIAFMPIAQRYRYFILKKIGIRGIR